MKRNDVTGGGSVCGYTVRNYFKAVFSNRVDIAIWSIGALCCAASVLLIEPLWWWTWFDAVYTMDTAANLVNHGIWDSHVMVYAYNPMHIFIAVPWFKVFGVSHLSSCALGTVAGFVFFIIASKVLSHRGILDTVPSVAAFAALFWGGWDFSLILHSGRIDMLVALFTLPAVVLLITPGCRPWPMFAASFCMMLSGVYGIPVFVFLGIMLLATAKGKENRKTVFRKGLASASGVAAAFAVSCLYYAYHRSLVRFVHSYFSNNASLSGGGSLFSGLCNAYLREMQALILYVVALALTAAIPRLRKSADWRLVVFIGCIPALAQLSGRYAYYYAWLFFLPAAVFFLWVLSRLARKRAIWTATAIVFAAIAACRVAMRFESARPWQEQRAAKLHAAEKQLSEVKPGDNVVINDLDLYYALVSKKAVVWYRNESVKTDSRLQDDRYQLTPRQKVEKFINNFSQDAETRKKIWSFYDAVEREYTQTPPDNAIEITLR